MVKWFISQPHIIVVDWLEFYLSQFYVTLLIMSKRAIEEISKQDVMRLANESLERLKKRKRGSKEKFECLICNKKMNRKQHLQIHLNMHTGQKSLKCPKCDYRTHDSGNIKCHINFKHSDERPFVCKEEGCEKSYKSKRHLKNHFVSKHTKEKPYHCTECDKKFALRQTLRTHLQLHSKETPFNCNKCDKAFKTKGYLRKHMIYHLPPSISCSVCDKKVHDLKKHMRKHSNEKKIKCNFCEKMFKCTSGRTRHERIHTNDYRFTCEYCDKKFLRSSHHKIHVLRWHTKIKNFKCFYCEKKFYTKDDRYRHERVHTGEKPFQCSECEHRTTSSSNLANHFRRIHLKEKKYQCSFCEDRFYTNNELKNHEAGIHTEVKPFQCKICTNSYVTRTRLKLHMKSHELKKDGKPARRQEENLAEFLRKSGFQFEWDKRVYICDEKGHVYSTQRKDEDDKVYNRPDFVINSFLDRIVIISCDEHEHNSVNYTWECELARMQKIMASYRIAPKGRDHEFDPRPIQWIRWNPNAFKIDGVTKRTSMKARHAKLMEVIKSGDIGLHYIGYSLKKGKLAYMESYLKEKLDESPGDPNLLGFMRMAQESFVHEIN